MKITDDYLRCWGDILGKSVVPEPHKAAVEEMRAVLGNPLYHFTYWEKRRDGEAPWPNRWMNRVSRWMPCNPSWFLTYGITSCPFFGFGFEWDQQFDLYGDVLCCGKTTHPVSGSSVSVIAEVDTGRIVTHHQLSRQQRPEPTLNFMSAAGRCHWIAALDCIKPPEGSETLYVLLKTVISDPLTQISPWLKPPVWNDLSGLWEGANPSPFLVFGKINGEVVFGLSYWWEKGTVLVYGGVQHRKRQELRVIATHRIKRIAPIDLTLLEKGLGLEPAVAERIDGLRKVAVS